MLLDEPKHKGSAPSPVLRAYQGRFALSGWKKTCLFPLFFVFFLFSVPAWATTCTYGDSLATNGGLGGYTNCTYATLGANTNTIINTHYSNLVAANPTTVVVSMGSNDGSNMNSAQITSHLNQIHTQTGATVVYIMPPSASSTFQQAVTNGATAGGYQVYTAPASDVAADGVHLTAQGYKNTMNAVNSGQANNTSGSQVNSANSCTSPSSSTGTSTSTPTNSVGSVFTSVQSLTGQDDGNYQNCQNTCPGCCTCHIPIIQNHRSIRAHTTSQFEIYRYWLVFEPYVPIR